MRITHVHARLLAIATMAVAFGCGSSGGGVKTGGAGTGATGSAGSGAAGSAGSGAAGSAGSGAAGSAGSGAAGSAGSGAAGSADMDAGADAGTAGSSSGDGGLASRPQPKGDFTVGTPSAAGVWTPTPVMTGTVPAIIYPSSETRFPRNIYRTLFQWKAQGLKEFRLSFVGPGTHVTVYVDGKHADCVKAVDAGCWEADEESWFLIAYGNAGQTVQLTVDGLDTSTQPATVRRSAPITIGFSKQDVVGAIFYWSTTSAGIRRANIAAARPEDYITGKPSTKYTTPADAVKCVACHVVSRDGKYMVAPVDAMSGGSLWVMEVTKEAPPNPLVKKIANTKGHGFATISPDDATVIAAFAGKMWTVDRATGTFGANLNLGGLKGTHPDWSPLGNQVVFATAAGDAPAGASLALLPFQNATWGMPKTIVDTTLGGTKPAGSNLFPMHSPDGKWIAFNRGKGGHGDLTSQLWTVPAAGGAPVELTNANRVVSNQMTDGTHENAQPTWAPPGDLHWIAFNSVRPYGVVLPKGTQQIWVAAVDPAKLASGGVDPSFPAFRLQFQGLQENNHRAYWTLDVRYPDPPPPVVTPPPDGGMCVADMGMCDPVADTCCDSDSRCDTMDDGATYRCGLF